MKGRKPEGDAIHLAKGNPGKRRRSPTSAAPALVNGVAPPKWLKKSRAASEVWATLAPALARINALSDLDAFPFARYCRYVVDWIAADESVRKEGVWYDAVDTNGNATKKRHPAFHARQELDKVLREIEAAFGMRPDTRFKILRDQAAAAGHGLGGLFGDEPAPQPRDDAPARDPVAEPIGSLTKLDSLPPGTLPN